MPLVVAVINAFHIEITAIDIIGQGFFQQVINFDIFYRAALHSQQVVLFIHFAPIDNRAEFLLKNAIQPNMNCTPFVRQV